MRAGGPAKTIAIVVGVVVVALVAARLVPALARGAEAAFAVLLGELGALRAGAALVALVLGGVALALVFGRRRRRGPPGDGGRQFPN